MLGAGDLRDRVTFQRRTSGANVGGVTRTTYTDLFSRSAKLTPTKGGEQITAGRLAGQGSWDLWVRYDSDTKGLNTGDRVVDARDPSRVFDIRWGPEDMDNRKAFLLMQLQSGGSGQ